MEGCKFKGYVANNYFRKHMLSQSLHVAWDKFGRYKKSISKSRIQDYKNITL